MKHGVYLFAALCSQAACADIMDPPPLMLDPLNPEVETEPAAATAAPASGADTAAQSTPPTATGDPALAPRFKTPLVEQEKTRVAVLGYHNFSNSKSVTRMLMRTSVLREQMERIRLSDCSVISMKEFLEWKLGNRQLPAECILITLDDGWRSVYTDAYPIFKEYGYPFHLFLYTDYLHGQGDSMTPEMVREMMQHGASVGSHSDTHPYPSDWKKAKSESEEAYQRMIEREIGATRPKLEEMFGHVDTYCYPGGYNDEAMRQCAEETGYVAAFTVMPGKVSHNEAPLLIDRYMILGTDGRPFEDAMDFSVVEIEEGLSTGSTPGALPRNTPKPTFDVTPLPDSTVGCTLPTISAKLDSVPGIDLDTVSMRVSGFGYVPHKTDRTERSVQWTAPCRVYMPLISVHLSWKTTDGTQHRAAWSFRINRTPAGQ